MDTNAESLVQHWTWAAKKGLMNANTAAGLRGACLQVLGVLGDEWKVQDISAIDVEDVLHRFTNLRKKDFKPAVLEAYRARFRKALSSYNDYLRDPGGWKPSTQEKSVTSERRARSRKPELRADVSTSESIGSAPAVGSVDYNFPLRTGVMARLVLPSNLTKDEVNRLSAFMSMLVIEHPKAVVEDEDMEAGGGN
jgi:hypothetical protein